MATYYISNGRNRSDPAYWFTGWDDLDLESVEATYVRQLGLAMPHRCRERFRQMASGETSRLAGTDLVLQVL